MRWQKDIMNKKKDIEILFNNINYYQENLKIYNDNMREKLEKELLRVRKMKLNNSTQNYE